MEHPLTGVSTMAPLAVEMTDSVRRRSSVILPTSRVSSTHIPVSDYASEVACPPFPFYVLDMFLNVP